MNISRLRIVSAFVMLAAIGASGCGGATVDVARTVKVGQLTTGWFDAGIVGGKNKLVPSASFTVTNEGRVKLGGLQIYAVFRLVGETEELGSAFVVLRGNDALAGGATSKPITVRATWGFTSEEPRAQMLMHKNFQDARVEVFGKYGSAPFVKLAEAPVQRQLLTK
jgi:hypothetical protein